MFKYTSHGLKKLENLFAELAYTIRYEKGNFQSGYCVVENRKIAVINKFFDTEGRINVLLEILGNIEFDREQLSESALKLLRELDRNNFNQEEASEPSK